MVKHEKLNLPESPCEPSSEYNFASCVERSIITRAGCQPPWRRFTVDNIPVCSNWSMLAHFGKEYERIMFMFRDDLIETTKCSLPCTFLEYKVIHHVIMPLFSILTQTDQLTDNRQLLIKCDYQNRSHSIFFPGHRKGQRTYA